MTSTRAHRFIRAFGIAFPIGAGAAIVQSGDNPYGPVTWILILAAWLGWFVMAHSANQVAPVDEPVTP